MSIWGGAVGSRRQLQFVTPAPPPPPPPPPEPELDDDVWGEELPEDALQEAILLESQQYTEPRPHGAGHRHAADRQQDAEVSGGHAVRQQQQQQQQQHAAAAGGQEESDLLQLRAELRRLRQDNNALGDQLKAAKADKYSQRGEVSVLREELTRRSRELENCRLENSRQLQEQQQQLEQSTLALNKDLDALRTELQFKSHELAEVTRQCRVLRSPGGQGGSPPRKMARLSTAGSPERRRGFITSSEFRKPEARTACKETAATQTDTDPHQDAMDCDELPACHLVSAVLLAAGDARWLTSDALAALAQLADQPRVCAQQATRAADLLAAAAAARLAQYQSCADRLQTASDADRRLCTLGSGRRRAAALLALLREEQSAVLVLSALRRLAEWSPALSARLLSHRPLAELLPRLLRPAITEGEVRNLLMMEYTAALLATMASDSLPDSLVQSLEPAVHEVLNTKPPARLLSALLELLASTAGTGQIAALWCRPHPPDTHKSTGTCLVKKLSILFSEWGVSSEWAGPSHRLPASHSRHRPAAPVSAAAALRGQLSPPQLRHWTVTTPPALDCSSDCQWVRLVALVLSRQMALPPLDCCRSNLTLLVVQLLYKVVNDWEHGGGGDPVSAHHLLPALHRLSDLDPAFSSSVSRERLRYLVTMETLGRRWRQMQLTPQLVGVLQELYKFEPGTFDGASQSQSS